jgi:predicted transcriptional regulator
VSDQADRSTVLALATKIVSAHVSNNHVDSAALPGLIEAVFGALSGIESPQPVEKALVPAVPVKKSVFPDHIVCLEDGKKLKMLKRHLMTSYKLTPEQYREKWNLPASYPMVAPNYAEHRSALAKSNGLGRKPMINIADREAGQQVAPKAAKPKRPVGRPASKKKTA